MSRSRAGQGTTHELALSLVRYVRVAKALDVLDVEHEQLPLQLARGVVELGRVLVPVHPQVHE